MSLGGTLFRFRYRFFLRGGLRAAHCAYDMHVLDGSVLGVVECHDLYVRDSIRDCRATRVTSIHDAGYSRPDSSVRGLAPVEKSEFGSRVTPRLFRLTPLDRGNIQHRTVAGFHTVLMSQLSRRFHALVFQLFQLLRVL